MANFQPGCSLGTHTIVLASVSPSLMVFGVLPRLQEGDGSWFLWEGGNGLVEAPSLVEHSNWVCPKASTQSWVTQLVPGPMQEITASPATVVENRVLLLFPFFCIFNLLVNLLHIVTVGLNATVRLATGLFPSVSLMDWFHVLGSCPCCSFLLCKFSQHSSYPFYASVKAFQGGTEMERNVFCPHASHTTQLME